eukprot:7819071-Alexandrium_andersonii.AAC.1
MCATPLCWAFFAELLEPPRVTVDEPSLDSWHKEGACGGGRHTHTQNALSLIHISEPTRLALI